MSISAPPSVTSRVHPPSIDKPGWRTALLGCGIAAVLLYLGMDLLAASRYDGYSYTDQTISELSAVGAPTRSVWIPLGFVYSILTIGCGLGVWASAAQNRLLRVVAVFVAGVGLLGLVGWPFAPMHQREVLAAGGGTISDTMHLVLAAFSALLFVLSIAFGATALGKGFRIYSVATILIVLAFGAFTGTDASKISHNDPTPWVGITERIAVFGSMLWIAVLAAALIRVRPQATGGRS